ncbi:hypothetical protein K1719_031211 [Acacia pycnantha]|nr:hypothetical protein K1719_031211 [Acacia pycnantha]
MSDGIVKTIVQRPGTEGSSFPVRLIATIAPVYKSKEKPPLYHFNKNAQALPCIAMLRSSNYEEEFPALELKTNDNTKVTRRPYVVASEVTLQGPKLASPADKVHNWHTDNVVSQNNSFIK